MIVEQRKLFCIEKCLEIYRVVVLCIPQKTKTATNVLIAVYVFITIPSGKISLQILLR
jgi:hypothetical protein